MKAELTRMERLLLIAAAVHGFGPHTDLREANTKTIVAQALDWAGLYADNIRKRWGGVDDDASVVEVIEKAYLPLIEMVQVRPRGERSFAQGGDQLFEGGGNWGAIDDPACRACDPHFNACRLTERGEQLAMALMSEEPNYSRTI